WQVAPATTAAWAWILSPSASASGSDNGTAGPAEGGTGGLTGGVVVAMMGSKQGRRTTACLLSSCGPGLRFWVDEPTKRVVRRPVGDDRALAACSTSLVRKASAGS